eukprot:4805689-Prymnesium_polylepis.1
MLVDTESKLFRLVIALLVSIFFLVALLSSNPYQKKFDFAMAAGCQLLFVNMFLGGLFIRLYEDIANDTLGSPELAFRFLGLHSSEQAVAFMICVAFAMLVLFWLTLAADAYKHIVDKRLRSRWAVCTTHPPYIERWRLRGIYACFLSHYKIEAASEARYMHDVLRKMLKQPVFLDSSTLSDLRYLVSEG